jgi:hypothetical protein
VFVRNHKAGNWLGFAPLSPSRSFWCLQPSLQTIELDSWDLAVLWSWLWARVSPVQDGGSLHWLGLRQLSSCCYLALDSLLLVTVGTTIPDRPPHRTVRAAYGSHLGGLASGAATRIPLNP